MEKKKAWAGEEKTLWSCHHIRHLHTLDDVNRTPRVKISYLFTSHDHIHHVRIQWEGHPLLLFSDPKMVDAHPADRFRSQAGHVTHQQFKKTGRPRTVPTVLRGTPSLMSVMCHTSTITLLPLAQTPFHDGKTGMTTTQWATNSIQG